MDKSAIDEKLTGKKVYDVFYEKDFFHDYRLKKIRYSIAGNKFSFVLIDDCKEYLFTFTGIFKISSYKDFFVAEQDYDDFYTNVIPLSDFFKPWKSRHLLYIEISKSTFTHFSEKYFRKTALNVKIDFDFGYNFELDCKDFDFTEQVKTEAS